jgi:hypothetical protein
MTDNTMAITGGCMCGAVRYEAVGEPFWVGHCHCSSCRRHTGAPVVTFVSFKEEQVTFTEGERRIYNSSPGVGRAFCGHCGTTLTWEGVWGDFGPIVEFHISSLDNPVAFVPQSHVFHEERIAWFDVADALPRYATADHNVPPCGRGPVSDGLPG